MALAVADGTWSHSMSMSAAKKVRKEAEADIAPPPRAGHRFGDLASKIWERAKEPWVSLSIGGDEVTRLRLGAVAFLTGGPGAGKSTLACAFGVQHLRTGGCVVFMSVELDGDELAARIVGMECNESWERVLRGQVSLDEMERVLDMPRAEVIDGDDATLPGLEVKLAEVRAAFPDAPVLVVVDYIQIVPAEEKEIRARVAGVAQALRRIAKRHRVVVLGISQPSRAAGNALRNGEALGLDTMSAMAETAEIERAAYVTLAIGKHGSDREDGTRHVDLSIGKGRMGGGDRVLPMDYSGASGRWRVAGLSKPAAEVRAEQQTSKDAANLERAEAAALGRAQRAKAPLTREELKAGNGKTAGKLAIEALLDRGELVEVRQKNPRASAWKIWTREKAEKAGVPIVEDEP
jgi:KaiC/GvpD/RAD55 family RecA-like ATPase